MPAEAEPQGHQRYRVGQGGETAPPDPRGHQRYAAPGVPNATPAPPPSSSASPPWRRRAAFALNALIAAYALALAILALVIWTAPLDWWPVSLFLYGPRWFVGLPFLVLVPIALAFGPWRRRLLRVAVLGIAAWTLLVPILGLCVPWRTWLGAMRMTTTTAGTPPATRLRVLSANVEGASFDAARLALLIADARPDLVLLQEWSGSTEPSEFLGTGPWFVQQDYGLLLASRFPIRSHEPIDLASLATRGLASRSIVELPGGATVPVLNIHLPTPRPGLEALIARRHDGVDQFREITAAQWAASDAVRTRARVTDGLIVGGDFNLPIESPVFRHFWSDLTDAFSRAGLGLGFTRLGGWSIRVRIDHILSGPGWKAVSARVGPAIGSDHRPVLAELVRAGAVAAPVPSDARSVFLDPGAIPDDPKARPRLIAIPTPAFPAARAIWGATGRDASGRVWLGVSSDENQLEPPGSAHLMSLDPASGRVTDHADVLAQLDRLGLARPGQSQMKIHSRIVPGPDGLLYFASGDEAGADWDTARDPTWGGHLWRFHPDRPDRWEHLAATPESLIAVAAGGDSVYALGYFGHALYQYHVPTGRTRSVRVGAVGSHISRNFFCDARGHAFVTRYRHAPGSPARLVLSLVEFDSDLNEIGQTELDPVTYFGPMTPRQSHGITGTQPLRDGSIAFVTHVGHLYLVRPRTSGLAEIRSLGWMHPAGPCRIESLLSPDGQRHLAAISTEEPDPTRANRWIVRDLERRRSVALALTDGIENIPADAAGTHALGAEASLQNILLYGSTTRDDAGHAYLVGAGPKGPLLVQARWSDETPPFPILPRPAAITAPQPKRPEPAATATAPTPSPTVNPPAAMARAKPPADPAADFHRELRARLDQPDPTAAGQAILELVRSRAAQSENHPADAARAALVARSGLLDRRGRIRTLRSAGLPEPAILEALIAHEARSIGTRNGPRNPAEAAVLAARLLLTMPPPAASTSP